MNTKKTILVSALTTLATMFILMICMHMCKSNCGQSKCGKAAVQCGSSYGHGSGNGHGKCANYTSSCSKKSSCSSKSKCSKGKSACSSSSKCSKGTKCCKSKTSCKKGDVKTCKYKDGEKVVIKKVIEVNTEE